MRCRYHSWLAWLAVAGGGIALILPVFLLYNLWDHHQSSFPANLGNEKAAVLLSQHSGRSNMVKFAVIGDINNGMQTFEAVVSRLKEENDMDFLVLLGDCAADPNQLLHEYFIEEFSETGLKLPTFIVAGNHDVEPGRFGYSAFENLYGPANFAFLYNGHLIIGLGGIHSHEKLQETLAFLEKTLRENRSKARKVFVFMHFTPNASEDIPTDSFEYSPKFQALFEKYTVTYVFSGHYHRLARTEVNGVVYFVTGGGGARLRQDRFADIGLFHHLTIIKIQDDSSSEHIIPIYPSWYSFKVLGRIEQRGLTILVPWALKHPFFMSTTALGVLGIFIWGIVDRLRYTIVRTCRITTKTD